MSFLHISPSTYMLAIMSLLLPGEIQLSPAQIIEPDAALLLGRHLLSSMDQDFDTTGYRVRVSVDNNGETPAHIIGVTGEPAKLLDDVLCAYEKLLQPNEQAFDRYAHWLISGANGSNIPWHTDTPGDVRFMLNLSDVATFTKIATKWNPEAYAPGDPDGLESDEHERLVLEPARMYASNTLATNLDVLRPHETPAELSRLVLRTSLYAATDWQEHAEGDGLAIELGWEALPK